MMNLVVHFALIKLQEVDMSSISSTQVQVTNTLDPNHYDSDDNSGESVDPMYEDACKCWGTVWISPRKRQIGSDSNELGWASVPYRGTAVVSAIPIELINLLLT